MISKNIFSGLIHYWPVNGSTIDDIGQKNMVIRSNGQLTADRYGIPNSALRFSGGFASVPPGVYFDPATGGFTFMAWIQVFSYNSWQRIFDFGISEANENILLTFPFRYDKLRLDTYNAANKIGFDFTMSVRTNVWYHIAVSVSAGVSTFYQDGIKTGGGTGKFFIIFK